MRVYYWLEGPVSVAKCSNHPEHICQVSPIFANLTQMHLFVRSTRQIPTLKQPWQQSPPIKMPKATKTIHIGTLLSGVCSHYGSFSHSSRLSRLSSVRPTFELIRPSQFLRCPPWDSTATGTLNWFICSVMFCWAETEREEMLQWNHCLHTRLQG